MTDPSSRRRRTLVAATVAAAMLITGCANAISGSAQPALDVPGLTSDQTATGGTESSPTDSSETGTGQTGTGQTGTGLTDSSESDTGPSDTTQTDSSTGESPSTATDDTTANTSADTGTSATSTQDTGSATTQETIGSTDAGTTSSGTAPGDEQQYPTAPLKLNKFPSTDESAALLESRRLGAYVVDPSAVMPEFTEGHLPTLPLKSAQGLSLLLTNPAPQVASRAGMYAGFIATRGAAKGPGSLITAVLVFPDAAKAQKAATDLSAASKSAKDTKVTVPGQSAAVGWTGKTTDGYFAHAFLPSGPLVVYSWAELTAAKKDTLPGLLSKTFAAQLSALAGYKPTPKADLNTLPVDPEGVYARALPIQPGKGQVTDGYYTAAAQLHFMSSFASDGKLFSQAGVDAAGSGRSTVYRAKDEAGATLIRDAYNTEIRTKDPKMTDYPVPEVDGVKCLEDTLNASYYCTGAVGRYAFEYRSESQEDVKKSMASQVAMLKAP